MSAATTAAAVATAAASLAAIIKPNAGPIAWSPAPARHRVSVSGRAAGAQDLRCPTVVVSSGRQHRPDKLRKCRVSGARRASEKFLQGR